MSELIDNIKKHIRLEDNMDDSMLSFYLDSAKRYVTKKVGYEEEYLVVMVTTVMFEHRSSSDELAEALKSLEPIFGLEVLTNAQRIEVDSGTDTN